jgi:hypothetical protein
MYRKLVVMGFAAVILAIGGFAFAAIPDRSGVIHACYKKKKGTLRVSSSGRCSRKERKLAWNRRGRTGNQGARGRPGPRGPAGTAGKDGSALAFALVNGNAATGGDTVNGAKSKNVTDAQVTHPAVGLYCFNLSFTPASVVATADWVSGGVSFVATASLTDSGLCSGSESASVRLRDVETPTDKDGNVFVVFN